MALCRIGAQRLLRPVLTNKAPAVFPLRPTMTLPIRQYAVPAKSDALVTEAEKAAARPFKGASRSEPDMPYIECPSMFYASMIFIIPFVGTMWGGVQYV